MDTIRIKLNKLADSKSLALQISLLDGEGNYSTMLTDMSSGNDKFIAVGIGASVLGSLKNLILKLETQDVINFSRGD